MSKKKTHNEYIEEVRKKFKNEYEVLSIYKGGKKEIKIKHECGWIYETTALYFLQGKRLCPVCNKNSKIIDTNIFKEKVKRKVGDEYVVLSEYKNKKTKIKFKHCKCKSEFEITPDEFLNANGRCPYCGESKKRIKDTEFFKKELKIKLKDKYELLSEYTNSKTKVILKHKKCGTTFKVFPNHELFKKKNLCPKCEKFNMNITIDFVKDELEMLEKNKEYKILSTDYKNTHTPLKLIHKKCGKIVYISRTNLLANKGCKYCNAKLLRSKEEIELENYIRSIYNGKIETSNRDLLNGHELDIFLPQINIAFEFNGLYWHSELKKKNNYHQEKTFLCRDKNIRLIHIFEDEWLFKKKLIKNKIKYILNLSDKIKIYARKCFIKEISSSTKNKFLNKYHIQGEDKSKIKLGLFFYSDKKEKNILVSVMTFCKPRISLGQKNSSNDFELSRFASSSNYIVLGGFSKLFNYFKKNYKWKSLITYADLRWSYGNVYLKNGWKLKHISKPNYWYMDTHGKKQRQYRFKFRKQNLKYLFPDLYSKDKTEKQIMKEANYIRIYDSGNMVFIYNK